MKILFYPYKFIGNCFFFFFFNQTFRLRKRRELKKLKREETSKQISGRRRRKKIERSAAHFTDEWGDISLGRQIASPPFSKTQPYRFCARVEWI
jgi:hypothetical protein